MHFWDSMVALVTFVPVTVEKQVAVPESNREVGVPCVRNLGEETLLKISLILNMFN